MDQRLTTAVLSGERKPVCVSPTRSGGRFRENRATRQERGAGYPSQPPNSHNGAVRRMRTSLRLPNPAGVSGREKAAPLGESGGAVELVVVAVLEMALRWEVVVDRGMD